MQGFLSGVVLAMIHFINVLTLILLFHHKNDQLLFYQLCRWAHTNSTDCLLGIGS